MCFPGESLMRTPTLFKLLMCCMLLVVAALALPTSAWTAPGGITDPGTEAAATPTGDGIATPAAISTRRLLWHPRPSLSRIALPACPWGRSMPRLGARPGTLRPLAAGRRHRPAVADTPQALMRMPDHTPRDR
jgi:hypothetical protein